MARKKPFDEQGINRRFRQFREKAEGARGKLRFAQTLHDSHSNISRYERGRTIPAHVIARAMLSYGVNPQWLLTGKGAMFLPTGADEVRKIALAPIAEGTPPDAPPAEFHVLPLLRHAASAAPGHRIAEDDIERAAVLHRSWCPHPATSLCLRAEDNAMEPAIPAGAVVTLDMTRAKAESLTDQVVAIHLAQTNQVVIRRLRADARQPRRVIAVADHATAENRPIALEAEDRIIGRVSSVHALVG